MMIEFNRGDGKRWDIYNDVEDAFKAESLEDLRIGYDDEVEFECLIMREDDGCCCIGDGTYDVTCAEIEFFEAWWECTVTAFECTAVKLPNNDIHKTAWLCRITVSAEFKIEGTPPKKIEFT